ncbi:MAG: WxL domain-containing protein, partial [Levilactobacillus brevis]
MTQFSQKLLTLMTVTVLGAATVPVVAHASSAETQGAISFIDDDGATAPVDPVNPGTPLPDTDPNNPATGNTGTLTLDVAPRT